MTNQSGFAGVKRPAYSYGHKARRRSVRGQVSNDRLCTSPTLEHQIRSDLATLFQGMQTVNLDRTDRFRWLYLEREIFSKYLDPAYAAGAEGRKTAAIKKWRAAELRNRDTNVRLYADETSFQGVSSLAITQFARNTIRKVLGDSPDLEVLYGTFTSGASTKFQRGPGALEMKFMDEAHVTPAALPWFQKIRSQCEGWAAISDGLRGTPLLVEVVRGSVMFTVPKTSEIDRCAAKEPGLNMFLQKGIGDFIRSQIRSKLRLDLNDQTHNQRLALQGSRDGTLATLDLSSASDLISHQLVFSLLPLDWFHLLNDVRSHECCVDGEWLELNMFSSMGNAFTFELETLIFWALVNAVAYLTGTKGTISVYGDDIVCPSKVAGLVARVFAWFGFKVNPKKSFWRGPFRESCGKHWYAGVDVTPFYVKEPIVGLPRLIHFLNRFRNWAGSEGYLDPRCYALWAKYRDLVPRDWRGGRDLSALGQLVTDESPRCRLIKVKEPFDVSAAGCYLHWLRAADKVDTRPYVSVGRFPRKGVVVDIREPLITSRVLVETSAFRSLPLTDSEKHQRNNPSGYVPGWP